MLLGATEKHEATARVRSAAKGAAGPKAFGNVAASLYSQDQCLPVHARRCGTRLCTDAARYQQNA